MKLLLGAGLVLPLVGAVATVVVAGLVDARRGRSVGVGAAILAAMSWAIVVSADTPPAMGRIEAHAVPAAAVSGLALLVAARLPRASLAASSSLCAVTLFAVASTTGLDSWPDRPLALGVAVLGFLVAARLRAEEVPTLGIVALVAGAAALSAGLLLSDEGTGAALVIGGAAAVMVAAVRRGTALLLTPVTLYAVARAADAAHAAGPDEGDLVAGAVVVAALVATAAIHLSRRLRSGRLRSSTERIPVVAAAGAAVVLLGQDPVAFRSAGALLAAGAVLAATTTRPLALAACLPGAAAAVEVFGDATDPVHAAAGGACIAVLIGALAVPLAPAGAVGARAWPLLPAVAFAVVPLWGWTGVDDPGYADAVAVSAAAGLVVGVGVVVARSLPAGTDGLLGKLRGRPPAPIHASTHPRAEEADLRQVDRDIASALEQ